MRLLWSPRDTPDELRPVLVALGEEYPIQEGSGAGLRLSFVKVREPGCCQVDVRGRLATIGYATTAQAGRALGALLGGLAGRGLPYRESTPFATFGVMLDCSRNAVMTVEHLRLWLRRLALLGYNALMLYTEDTYELSGEPYFGWQRGAYTRAELQAVEDYAARLNIEFIPCLQTLGHLDKILRHEAYAEIRDTPSVMLVGEPRTYALIEKMIRHWRSICRTRRIHIGMDETHDLGRGRYLDLHGYRRAFDLFNEHLARVVGLCEQSGLRPMIWSDMYFRLGSRTGDYYDTAAVIPDDVVARIPAAAQLVYWDYYHDRKDFYLDWIRRHRHLGKEPVMASGVWTWNKYWYDRRLTEANAGACVEACREAGVGEVFLTLWGDNGAYCDHDSAFAGLVWCAARAYGEAETSPGLERRFSAVCGGSYAAHVLAGEMHGGIQGFEPDMWDDPIFETHLRSFAGDSPCRMAGIASGYSGLAHALEPYGRDRRAGDLGHALNTARTFAERYALVADLLSAYRGRDISALAGVLERIPRVVKAVKAMESSFRRMWLGRNKPHGLETIQGRFGALEARYRELSCRLGEYLRGSVESIPELDHPCPPR